MADAEHLFFTAWIFVIEGDFSDRTYDIQKKWE